MVKERLGETEHNQCAGNDEYGYFFSRPNIKPESIPECDLESLKRCFCRFNTRDLIATLGGLQVHPCNHVHAIRLETASQIACSLKASLDERVRANHFQEAINKFLPTISSLGLKEDPPERLFTENIGYHGGNYVVYPSIYHEERYVIEILIEVLSSFYDEFPEEFVQDTYIKISWILRLSNEIANRLGHVRYQDSPYDWKSKRTDIYVPQDLELAKYRESVVFNIDEIREKNPSFDIEVLRPFLTSPGKRKLQKANVERNPLSRTPLVHINNEIIVAVPGALLFALRWWIWAYAKKKNLEKHLAKRYRELLWGHSLKYLQFMDFEYLCIQLPSIPDVLPIEDGLFKFDMNKVAFIQLIGDNANDYKKSELGGLWKNDDIIDNIRRRDKEVIGVIREEIPELTEIFIIKILGGIGRPYPTLYEEIGMVRTLLLTYDELSVISQSGECDNLTLWKYAGANRIAQNIYKTLSFSFLDQFSFYNENHTLIYDIPFNPNLMPIPVGIGKGLRFKVAKMWDAHLDYIGEPPFFSFVRNGYQDPSIPIYSAETPIYDRICILVKGYFQPIWVIFDERIETIPIENIEFVSEFCKAVGYWIWQFTPKLKEQLSCLGEESIHIIIKFKNPQSWYNYKKVFFSLQNLNESLEFAVHNRWISVTIPDNFMRILADSNNKGERLLCEVVLRAFSYMINRLANQSTLTGKIIGEILEEFAPLSHKKQLLFVFAGVEGLLINNNLPEPRWLQMHDIQEQALLTSDELKMTKSKNGLIQSDQHKICNHIVVTYYERLKKELKEYHWEDLLKFLIGMNDSLLHHRMQMIFSSPFITECFSNKSQVVLKRAEQQPRVEKTTLCIRVLIEIIVLESPDGSKKVSIDDFDRLMAITHHFIEWANISEFYYSGLIRSDLVIQKSGRIAPREDVLSEKFAQFAIEKVDESIEGLFDVFEPELKADKSIADKFIKLPGPDESRNKLELACAAEFGLTFREIMNFFFCLIHSLELFICPEQKGPVYSLPRSRFAERIHKKLGWDEAKVNRAIQEFSLTMRNGRDEEPGDFKLGEEIKPWKYRRRQAHARRPLIIVPEPEANPTVLWGSLHAERSLKYLFELITEGRLDTTTASPGMRSYVNAIQKWRGDAFNQYAQEWFEKNTNWRIYPNVNLPIKSVGNSNTINLGDIDILSIDEVNKKIYSVECKDIHFGRNAKEIVNEIERLLKGTDKKEAWIVRHSKRDQWLRENLQAVIVKYSLPSGDYRIVSLMITSETVPSVFLNNADLILPVIPFTKIIREGIETIENL